MHTCKVLSVVRRPLLEKDFSFMFLKAGRWDSLITEVQVIILAHADEERIKKNPDKLAEAIAEAIDRAVRQTSPRTKPFDITYSVVLHLGEMGYYASSATLGEQAA